MLDFCLTQCSSIAAAQSTRLGGVSPVPYNSLNVGINTDDEWSNVQQNRSTFLQKLGFPTEQLATSHQIHDDKILIVEKAGIYEGYDALVTNQKHLVVGVSVADCVPILLYDAQHQVVAAIHAGWKGTALKIVEKTIKEMKRTFQSHSKHLFAYIGTCIDECSFEVDNDVAQHFDTNFKRLDAAKNKFFIDLKKANQAQLLEMGVPKTQIEISPYSTVLHNERYFSHRLEKGKTGRMLAAIGLKN